MSETTDARFPNRRIAGACLIAAPAVLLVGALVHPQVGHDASAHLAVAAQSPGRYYVAHAITSWGWSSSYPRCSHWWTPCLARRLL